MITLKLPMPPPANNLFANKAGRGRVKSERYRTWLNAAGWELKEQKPAKVEGEYCIWLYVERPDNRKRDLSNLIKPIEDLLVSHGVVEDDSKCAEVHLYWSGSGRGCTVKVEPAQPIAMARAA